MVKRYGNIRQFSGQGTLTCTVEDQVQYHYLISALIPGVEKNNDVAKRNYFSSNLQDPAGEILKTEARLEATQELQET